MKVLLTGASSGIGKEMAKILAEQGNELVLVAKSEERLNVLKEELSANTTTKITTISSDLSVQQNCIDIFEQHKDIDFLINNAGFGDAGKFDDTDLGKDTTMIQTNIIAVHTFTKLYLPEMKKRDRGHILNVASIAGYFPGPLMATYYATKNYVVCLSEAIREELKHDKSNVKISILCPGPVATNFEKTANVKFTFNGMDSGEVAKYALDHLNKFYIVPGFIYRMARLAGNFIPSSMAAKLVYKLQTPKRK